jgi:hypothetical protein
MTRPVGPSADPRPNTVSWRSRPQSLTSASLFSCVVLLHPGFDELLDERDGDFPVQRKVDGRLGRLVACQFLPMFLYDGRADVESDVLRMKTEPSQPPFVVIVRHPVTYAFARVRRRFLDCCSNLSQFTLRRRGSRRYVFAYALRWFVRR